jgi:hypothetical protein
MIIMTDMPFHEIANLFPLLAGAEYAALKADIEANGLHEGIWTHKGKIIDGRNRYRVCRELGREPQFREWDGNGSLVTFVVSLNLHRRHLTSSQRAAIAAEILPLLQAEAKERQRAAGGDRKSAKAKAKEKPKAKGRGANTGGSVPELFPEPIRDDGEARKQAAKAAGTNTRYVNLAAQVKECNPVLFEQMKAGEINVTQAAAKAKRQQAQEDARRQVHELETAKGKCGEWPLEIKANDVAGRLAELKAAVLAREEFVARKATIDGWRQQAREFEQEIERLYAQVQRLDDQAWDAERHMDLEAREIVEEEHGRAVNAWKAVVPIYDKDFQAKLEAAAQDGWDEEVRELLLNRVGRCEMCAAVLDQRDDVPDKPERRYTVCTWCRAHRGETHCEVCAKPIPDGGFDGLCGECNPEEKARKEADQRAFHEFLLDSGRSPASMTTEEREAAYTQWLSQKLEEAMAFFTKGNIKQEATT